MLEKSKLYTGKKLIKDNKLYFLFLSCFGRQNREGKIFIVATHTVQDWDCDRVIELNKGGEISFAGTLEEYKEYKQNKQ